VRGVVFFVTGWRGILEGFCVVQMPPPHQFHKLKTAVGVGSQILYQIDNPLCGTVTSPPTDWNPPVYPFFFPTFLGDNISGKTLDVRQTTPFITVDKV